MTARLQTLVRVLLKNNEAAMVTTAANRFYLLGIDTADAGTLLLTQEEAVFIIDSRYTEIAARTVRGARIEEQKDVYKQLEGLLQKAGAKRLYLEDGAPLWLWRKLGEALSGIRLDTAGELTKALSSQRMQKDTEELRCIRAAQKITDAAFNYMLTRIAPGRSERELALELDCFMRKEGSDGLAFDTILIGGANTSLPHGVPGDYLLQKGDFVTMDFGARWQGYCTDMTRTVALGAVTQEQRAVYETVAAAQAAGLAAVRAGKTGREIDAAARTLIEAAGYKGRFGHGLGHSVGVEIHEEPRFSPSCSTPVPEGAVMTVEPGIYLPEKFGVRIEDTVVVTREGCENLADSPKNLIEL